MHLKQRRERFANVLRRISLREEAAHDDIRKEICFLWLSGTDACVRELNVTGSHVVQFAVEHLIQLPDRVSSLLQQLEQ